MLENFPYRLKAARKLKGLSQQALADAINNDLGTSFKRSTVSNYETGESKPNLDILISIVKILDTSSDYLLCISQNETTQEKGQKNIAPNIAPNVAPIAKSQNEAAQEKGQYYTQPEIVSLVAEQEIKISNLLEDNKRLMDENITLKAENNAYLKAFNALSITKDGEKDSSQQSA